MTALYPAMNRWVILFRPCSGLEGDLPFYKRSTSVVTA
ncbi:MAG: hypothetical protein JWM16_3857 [Verrucomicrobiales bacterium]|nr:hypothetical protein [Verrucomicrobiales bacterium]